MLRTTPFPRAHLGVGLITTEEALARGITGPILRSTGFPWDLRKAQPYLAYDEVDFDVVYGSEGDVLRPLTSGSPRSAVGKDRAPMRRAHAGRRLPRPGQKVTPPPRARIDESMEASSTTSSSSRRASRSPPGETYVAIESPRGEIGCYMVSDGTRKAGSACTSGGRPSTTCRASNPWRAEASSPTRWRSSPASIRSWARWTDDGQAENLTGAEPARGWRGAGRS